MTDFGSANVKLTADVSNFEAGLKKALQGLGAFTVEVTKKGEDIAQNFSSSIESGMEKSNIGLRMQKALTKALIQGGGPLKAFEDLSKIIQKEMVNLGNSISQYVTPGGKDSFFTKTAAEADKLSQEIKKTIATMQTLAEVKNRLAAQGGTGEITSKESAVLYGSAITKKESSVERADAGIQTATEKLTKYRESLKLLYAEAQAGKLAPLSEEILRIDQRVSKLGNSSLELREKMSLLKQQNDLLNQSYLVSGRVMGEIGGKQVDFNQKIATNIKGIKEAETAVGSMGGSLNRMKLSIQELITWQVEWYLGQAVIFKAARAIQEGIKYFIEFDKQLYNLKAIVGLTSTEMEKLGIAARNTAFDSKFSATELGDAMVLLGQAGLNATQIKDTLVPISLLATATLTDMAKAADLVTTTMAAFSMKAEDAGKIVDVFAAATNYSKLTIEDMGVSFNYVASVAAQAGLSIQDVSAALAVMKDRGIKASTMGTSLRGILSALIAPTGRLKGELDRLGIALTDVNPLYNDFGLILKRLRDAGFDTENAFKGLDARVAAGATALISASGSYEEMRRLVGESGYAADMAKTQMDSFAISAKNLQNKLGELFLAVGDKVLPTFKLIVDFAGGVLNVFKSVGDSLGVVGTALGGWTGTVLATVIALGLFSTILSSTSIALSAFNTLLKFATGILVDLKIVTEMTAATMALTMGWFIAIAAVLGSLVYAYNLYKESVKKADEEQKKAYVSSVQNSLSLRDMKTNLGELQDKYKEYGEAKDSAASSDKKHQEIIDRLIALYPTMRVELESYRNDINKTTEAVKTLTEAEAKRFAAAAGPKVDEVIAKSKEKNAEFVEQLNKARGLSSGASLIGEEMDFGSPEETASKYFDEKNWLALSNSLNDAGEKVSQIQKDALIAAYARRQESLDFLKQLVAIKESLIKAQGEGADKVVTNAVVEKIEEQLKEVPAGLLKSFATPDRQLKLAEAAVDDVKLMLRNVAFVYKNYPNDENKAILRKAGFDRAQDMYESITDGMKADFIKQPEKFTQWLKDNVPKFNFLLGATVSKSLTGLTSAEQSAVGGPVEKYLKDAGVNVEDTPGLAKKAAKSALSGLDAAGQKKIAHQIDSAYEFIRKKTQQMDADLIRTRLKEAQEGNKTYEAMEVESLERTLQITHKFASLRADTEAKIKEVKGALDKKRLQDYIEHLNQVEMAEYASENRRSAKEKEAYDLKIEKQFLTEKAKLEKDDLDAQIAEAKQGKRTLESIELEHTAKLKEIQNKRNVAIDAITLQYQQNLASLAATQTNEPWVDEAGEDARVAAVQKLIDKQKELLALIEKTYGSQTRAEMAQYTETLKKAYDETPLQGYVNGLQKVQEGIGGWGKQVQGLTEGTLAKFADAEATAFTDMVTGAKTAKEAFKDFARSFITDVISMINKTIALMLVKQMAGLLGGMVSGGLAPMSNATFGPASSITEMTLTAARGGILPGAIMATRAFGSGGMTSRPTLALLGDNKSGKELVIPQENIKDDSASGYVRDKGGGENVIINLIDPQMVPALIAAYPDATLNLITADIVKRGITYQTIKRVK